MPNDEHDNAFAFVDLTSQGEGQSRDKYVDEHAMSFSSRISAMAKTF